MMRALAVFAAMLLCACTPKTKVVHIERTRLVVPVGFEQLTQSVIEPAICELINIITNGDLFQCRVELRTALFQCNSQLIDLRNQYEQVQKPSP